MELHNRYEIIKVLGSGASGKVYLAEDTYTHRKVAVKQYAGKTWIRELEMMASLNHRCIPQAQAAFSEDGCWYVVMDYIPGETLKDYRLKQGGYLLLDEVVSIGVHLASTFDYLHEQGILHCDLHPQNVLRGQDGYVALIDFAFSTTQGPYIHGGSRRYAPPEQNIPGDLDARADMYSLGVVLHELLTGTLVPLDPRDPIENIPGSTEPRYYALRKLLFSMMEYDRTKRPESMLLVIRALLRI